MVEIMEAKDWTMLRAAFVFDVGSLEDLKKLAEAFNIKYILKKGKEHLVICGSMGPAPVIYRFKE